MAFPPKKKSKKKSGPKFAAAPKGTGGFKVVAPSYK